MPFSIVGFLPLVHAQSLELLCIHPLITKSHLDTEGTPFDPRTIVLSSPKAELLVFLAIFSAGGQKTWSSSELCVICV